MGSGQSSTTSPLATLYARQISGGNYVGGSEAKIIGGLDQLQDYANSVYSKAKEDLIRGIAEDVATTLKVKSGWAKTDSIDNVVSKLSKVIPSGKNKITTNSQAHITICKELGKSINKRYGIKLIELNQPPSDMCNQVAEIIHTLFTGLHTEFLNVAGDIKNTVRNMQIMDQFMEGAYTSIKELAGQEPDQVSRVEAIDELYQRLKQESDRQKAILSNLVSTTIGPMGKSLISLLEESKSLEGLVKDLRESAGSAAFSDKLGYLLKGISTTAYAAEQVDKALKKIGISRNEYKKSTGLSDLRNKVYELITEKAPGSKELNKMMAAAEVLYKHDFAHADIVKHLDKVEGGLELEYEEERESRAVRKRRSLSAQVKKQEKFRKMLFRDFKKRLVGLYRHIVNAANVVVKGLGKDIPVTPELREFVERFSELKLLDRENIHMALTGYVKSVEAKDRKSEFMAAMQSIDLCLEALIPQSNAFKLIQEALHNLMKAVDDFSDKFLQAITEVPSTDLVKGSSEGELQNIIQEYSGGRDDDSVFVSIEKVKKDLEYYSRIAHLSQNLKRSSEELVDYSDGYEDMLGEEMAITINGIKKLLDDDLKITSEEVIKVIDNDNNRNIGDILVNAAAAARPKARNGDIRDINNNGNGVIYPAQAEGGGAFTNDEKSRVKGYRQLRKFQADSQVELLKAAQALDLYLSSFTKAITASPDEIKDLVKLLEQIDIVAKWFTEKSGDNVCKLFELCKDGNEDIKYNIHYYEDLGNITDNYDGNINNNNPAANDRIRVGNPDEPKAFTQEKLEKFLNQLEKSVKGNRALQNIIITFSKLGATYGNKSPQDDTFMSPGQFARVMSNYVIAASVMTGQKYDDYRDKTVDDIKKHELLRKTLVRPAPKRRVGPGNLGLNKYFNSTNETFLMMLKSMAAKVFTVVGTYSLLHQPIAPKPKDNAFSGLRMILGGDSSKPKVIPEAMELYVRLPLLAEWYRETLSFKESQNPGDELIVSMIPNFDGIWSDFIDLVFHQADYVNESSYSDRDLQALISCVNNIYTKYKSQYGSKATNSAINAFITEVNRRYGILKKQEINDYLADKNKRYDDDGVGDNFSADDRVDYDLLDEDNRISSIAPSDKYTRFSLRPVQRSPESQKRLQEEVLKLRLRMDKEFLANADAASNHNLIRTISQYKKQVEVARTDKERYEIVEKAVQGVSKVSTFNVDKVVAFTEMVQVPLHVLHGIMYKVKQYSDNINFVQNLALSEEQGNNAINFNNAAVAPGPLFTIILNKKLNDDDKGNVQTLYNNQINNVRQGFVDTTTSDTINNALRHAINTMNNFQLGSHGNVSVKFTNDNVPVVEYSDLQTLVEELISTIKTNIQKFRNVLSKEHLERFELAKTGNEDNIGSLGYLQGLYQKYFKSEKYVGLKESNEFLAASWKRFKTLHDVYDNGGVAAAVNKTRYEEVLSSMIYYLKNSLPAAANITNDEKNRMNFPFNVIPVLNNKSELDRKTLETNYAKLMSGNLESRMDKTIAESIIGVDAGNAPVAGANAVAGANDPAFLNNGNYTQDAVDAAENVSAAYKLLKDNQIVTERANYYEENDFNMVNNDQGLLIKFNEILAQYLSTMYDKALGKMYLPLIDGYANGSNSAEVMNGRAFPDISHGNVDVKTQDIKDPYVDSITFASLALAMRSIVQQVDRKTKTPLYHVTSLSEMPQYYHEKLRAYLPTYVKMFQLVSDKAQFLQKVLSNGNLDMKIRGTAAGEPRNPGLAANPVLNIDPVPNIHAGTQDWVDGNTERTQYLRQLCQNIHNSAQSIKRCAEKVIRELADAPLYGENYLDHMREFKAQNNQLPVTPLANMLTVLDHNQNHGLPFGSNGSHNHKFQYSTRLVLGRPDVNVTLDHMPGVKEVVEKYNDAAQSKLDMKSVESGVNRIISGMRYLCDNEALGWVLKGNDLAGVFPNVTANNVLQKINNNILSWVLVEGNNANDSEGKVKELANVLNVSESSDFDNIKYNIVVRINTNNDNIGNRSTLRIVNILELNIVPINVHALQREVPLVNLINYSYTFDKMIQELLIPDFDLNQVVANSKSPIPSNIRTQKPSSLLARLLAHPDEDIRDYIDNNANPPANPHRFNEDVILEQLMLGQNDFDLGRPKYLMDQLWGKVLLRNPYITISELYDGNANAGVIVSQAPGPTSRASNLHNTTIVNNNNVINMYRQNILNTHDNKLVYMMPEGKHKQLDKKIHNKNNIIYPNRRDTLLVRYLMFTTNLQRIIRKVVRDKLQWMDTPVIKASNVTNRKVTEYDNTEVFDISEYR